MKITIIVEDLDDGRTRVSWEAQPPEIIVETEYATASSLGAVAMQAIEVKANMIAPRHVVAN